MKKSIIIFFFVTLYLTGCITSNKHPLKVETTPKDALVSVHQAKTVSDRTRMISGITPLAKEVDFGESGQLLVEVEKRGFHPHVEAVSPVQGTLTISLKQIQDKEGRPVKTYSLPQIKRILLVKPDMKVIERGFSSEETSEDKSLKAQQSIITGVKKGLSGKCEVVTTDLSSSTEKLLRPLWRDVLSAMELMNPFRLKYLPHPPLLETKSSKQNAFELGKKYKADVILFIKSKKNLESAGLRAGIHASSATAIAVTSHNRSIDEVERQALRHIFKASFDSGATQGKIAVINCKNGEILHINRGLLVNLLADLSFSINRN